MRVSSVGVQVLEVLVLPVSFFGDRIQFSKFVEHPRRWLFVNVLIDSGDGSRYCRSCVGHAAVAGIRRPTSQ